ncbi:unnamed protein product [Schistosoma margrebowiei]|uniref:Uncharacterized protein n=1 Tax=Schistosoma margrebowiei TaxID=48269 RepID=A0A183LGE0_9TREM|nr:unnamed protein product [Schistosoma margrebowiei]
MVNGGSRQETLDLGFVLFSALQQSVPVILRELMLINELNPMSPSFVFGDVTTDLSGPMVVIGSRQETLDPCFVLLGTRQQSLPVILRELVLPDGFDPVSRSFTVIDITTNSFPQN